MSPVCDAGIIPARAGFTRCWSRPFRAGRDHPRSRGVYAKTLRGAQALLGSSPLARGLRVLPRGVLEILGIIPARAGFTTRSTGTGSRRPDHPRSRGVYGYVWEDGGDVLGSSPLARGLPLNAVSPVVDDRIIPARAGFTGGVRGRGRRGTDHPRSRGVYCTDGVTIGNGAGSSPLARGLPPVSAADRAARRIIPARAGFTGHGL